MSVFNHVKRFLSLVVVVCFTVTSLQPPSAYAAQQRTVVSEDEKEAEVYVLSLAEEVKKLRKLNLPAGEISRRLGKIIQFPKTPLPDSQLGKAASLGKLTPEKIAAFERELGISEEKLRVLVEKFPRLARYSPSRVKQEWKEEFGFKKETLATLIGKHPPLAGYSPSRIKQEWKEELGFEKETLATLIQKFPQLAGLSPGRIKQEWKEELGFEKETLATLIKKKPQLAGLSPGRVKQDWKKELGFEKETLATLIQKFPQLAGLSPGRIKQEWKEELGFEKETHNLQA